MSHQVLTSERQETIGRRGPATVFIAENAVSQRRASAMMALAPTDPFSTPVHAEAVSAAGYQTWFFGIEGSGQLVAGCYGFLRSGRLNRVLRIPSLPGLAYDDVFWNGLVRFCSLNRVTYLEVTITSSFTPTIPSLPGEVERRQRLEYVLDLRSPEWEQKLSPHHRRKINRALQTGVTLRRVASVDACRGHVRLRADSMERRRKRGEFIVTDPEQEMPFTAVVVEKGLGEFFQAVSNGQVLSSALVLRAADEAYYHSAGTSPEGMTCGASQFLIHSAARVLREESVRTFNLGGGEPNPELGLFKLRFGAAPVPFESATFYFGNNVRRMLTNFAHSLRRMGAGLAL